MGTSSYIFQYTREYMKKHAGAVSAYFLMTLNSPIQLVLEPYYMGRLIEKLPAIKTEKSLKPVKTEIVAIVLLAVSAQIGNTFNDYLDASFIPGLQAFVRQKIMEKVTLRNLRHFQDVHVGDFITKIIQTPHALVDITLQVRMQVLPAIYTFFGGIVYFFMVDWTLGILFISGIGIFVGILFGMGYQCVQSYMKEEECHDFLHEEMADYLENLQNVFEANATNMEFARLHSHHKTLNKKLKTSMHKTAQMRIALNAFSCFLYISMVGLSIWLFSKRRISIGSVTTTIMVVGYAISTINSLSDEIDPLLTNMAILKKVDNYLSKQATMTVTDPQGKAVFPQGAIEVRGMTFRHTTGGHSDPKPIFEDFNISIKAKSVVILTGEIGTGKTTLISLIMGRLTPQEGTVQIDGQPVSEVCASDLASAIVSIPQTPRLFNRSTYENIAYNMPDVSVAEVEDLMKAYGVTFVKIHETLGKGGSRLSGGQRQIIFLLRALLRSKTPRCSIVIFDEPTANLDEKTRDAAFTIIKDIVKNKTSIIISHDPQMKKLGSCEIQLRKR